MKVEERQALALRVLHFYANISNFNKFETILHFEKEGIQRPGLYAIIRRYEQRGTAIFRHKSGRKVKVATPENMEKVRKSLENTNNSIRDVAKVVGISKTRCQDIKKMLGIKTNKCQKVPKHTADQQRRAKTNCRKIYRKSINKILILDDETYVKIDPKANYGQGYYHFRHKNEVKDETRFTGTEKFGRKYLIWQCIDEFGNVSEPYISTGNMTSEEYKRECIEKRLLPFIKEHHKNRAILFWSDMARIHYGKCVQNILKQNNIEFVSYRENAPTVPQARPIENFWNICKQKYSKRRKPAKSLIGFRKIWKNISFDVQNTYAQVLTKGIRRTLKLIGDKGPLEPFRQ